MCDAIEKTTTTRSYNELGQITEEHLGNGLVLQSHYDSEGRRIQINYPCHKKAFFSYKGNKLHQVRYDLGFNQYTYTYEERNLSGKPTRIAYPNGHIHFTYDSNLRLKSMVSPHQSALNYTYSPTDQIISYNSVDPLGTQNLSYTYDNLDQLISENGHTYHYDSLYNRLCKDEYVHHVNTLCQTTDDGQTHYTYDKNGNLIQAGEAQFGYDALDRLTSVTKDGTTTTYTYDSFNRRLSTSQGWNTFFFLWDDQDEIGKSINGLLTELRVLGEGLGAEIGSATFLEINQQVHIPIHDHRGALTCLLYNDGSPHETYRYTAFGEELTGNTISPWRFASKRVDPETGYIYFGRRYYSPTLGKWISPDPIGYKDGPNLYAYVHNCPLTAIDLYGLWGLRQFGSDAGHFLWGAIEGSGYHLYNMASSMGMKNFSSNSWQPRSLSTQDLSSTRRIDRIEQAALPFTYEARRMQDSAPQHDIMRSRGRAAGEQLVTLGGLVGIRNSVKNMLNSGKQFLQSVELPQVFSREYLYSGKVKTPVRQGKNKNWLMPDAQAEGAHSVFRRDPMSGKVTHYDTYKPQSNPYDPKPWESVMRFDNPFEPHYHFNKVLKERIYTPHVHDPYFPGGVRPAQPREIP